MHQREAIILGALLHDIGKFVQRTGIQLKDEFSYKREKLKGHGHAKWSAQFIEKHKKLFPDSEALIDLVLFHGSPGKRPDNLEVRLISIADKLSSKERRNEDYYVDEKGKEPPPAHKVPLFAVFNNVNLGTNLKENTCAYDLKLLELSKETLFPLLKYSEEALEDDAYEKLNNTLNSELKDQNTLTLLTLYYLLNKYTWSAASATPKVGVRPDVSLFDHLRTTTAIALCLFNNSKLHTDKLAETLDNALTKEFRIKMGKEKKPLSSREKKLLEEPLFCLLSADMFGIQNFIYATLSIPGVSKRLRGRSFYLTMMNEVIARYIVNNLGLFIANILYCGGGRFDILLPNDEGGTDPIVDRVDKLIRNVNEWLFKEFYGEIGLVFGKIKFGCREFDEWDILLKKIDDKLSSEKKRKISKEGVNSFFPKDIHRERLKKEKIGVRLDVCKSCERITIDADAKDKRCELCRKHQKIGEVLPKTWGIVLCNGTGNINVSKDFHREIIEYGNFGKVYLIWTEKPSKRLKPEVTVKGKLSNIEYLQLNKTENFINAAQFKNFEASFGFKFLGNVAPLENGKVLEFEEIAKVSEGDKKLGILKIDVDHLGLIFKIGLSSESESDRTISRIATMSRMFDLFFSGYIHRICEKFKKIYIIYSGGDDLLLVGPWSEIPYLAQEIYTEFKEYTCKNPDITLSGGLFFCKEKFPVKRFAPLVGEELGRAKEMGRDKVAIFGETVRWKGDSHEEIPLEEILKFGEDLYEATKTKKIPRGFLHQLLRLHYTYFKDGRPVKVLYIPVLLYQIIRNIKDDNWSVELRSKLISSTDSIKWMEKIRVPVTYALLKSRR